MARYRIEISQSAERQLRKLRKENQRRVVKAMLALGDDPHPKGSRNLTGYEDVFRIRAGQFRILYSVSGRRLIIIILKVGQRKDVYR
jgi:mRNA interferase RelE/StbE